MDGNATDRSNGEIAMVDSDQCSSSSPGDYRLFDRKTPIHQIIGGGTAADIILWKCKKASICVLILATAVWFLFEKSGLSFLTICSDVLLIMITLRFIHVNIASLLNKQLRPLPELVLSEEMVHNAAATFRARVNNILMIAHDITLKKGFKLFCQVMAFLWLISVAGNFCSFFTFAYIGTIFAITVPAIYNKFEEHVDKYAGIVHRNISKHYKVVDENVISRLPKGFNKDKAS
ncbi:hypothetical protein LUZ60_013129 [Juncus effusus]|nr:hypothetical protein LUZ60_013129 [Juncus effusus]